MSHERWCRSTTVRDDALARSGAPGQMTRIETPRHTGDQVSLAAGREHTSQPGVMRVLGCRLLALGFVALLGGLLAYYPPGALWIAAALTAYAALLWWKPA